MKLNALWTGPFWTRSAARELMVSLSSQNILTELQRHTLWIHLARHKHTARIRALRANTLNQLDRTSQSSAAAIFVLILPFIVFH